MRLSGTSSLLSMLYDDRMDILRYTTSKNLDGTTETSQVPQPVLTDIPCRLSFSFISDNPNDIRIDENPINYAPTLFCGPSVQLKAGDYAIISRKDDDGSVREVYKGNIGQPAWYSNHQEVKFTIDESA